MNDEPNDGQPQPGLTRRRLIASSIAGSLAAPLLFGERADESAAAFDSLRPVPVYFPRSPFTPDIADLSGKLAVVTGASRGNGRAVGEALTALGASVIGTSRNPAGVPNPPAFPLVKLDVADAASVGTFPARLAATAAFRRRGAVDILANNAGRFVFGEIVPLSTADLPFYTAQRDLAIRTLYSGHVLMTNVMRPLMPRSGYARVIFTVSIAAWYTGENLPGSSGIDTYASAKTALRTYAANLRAALAAAGSNVRVSTVNPYVMHTALAQHPNPIYTQPVNTIGESPTDADFNTAVRGVRALLGNGLPPQMVGDTYGQLLRMTEPTPHVVVGSPNEPLATQGFNAGIEPQIPADNRISAIPLDTV
jgi:NAD(P)-dependent dehydrogenase (short-subunit alcohol dehydrogenase family)